MKLQFLIIIFDLTSKVTYKKSGITIWYCVCENILLILTFFYSDSQVVVLHSAASEGQENDTENHLSAYFSQSLNGKLRL